MPLLRMSDAPPRIDRWSVYFTMLSSDGTTLQCTVTRGALDTLLCGDGETTGEQQVAIFAARRAEIESKAIAKFARSELERGMLVLRPEDFPNGS